MPDAEDETLAGGLLGLGDLCRAFRAAWRGGEACGDDGDLCR